MIDGSLHRLQKTFFLFLKLRRLNLCGGATPEFTSGDDFRENVLKSVCLKCVCVMLTPGNKIKHDSLGWDRPKVMF